MVILDYFIYTFNFVADVSLVVSFKQTYKLNKIIMDNQNDVIVVSNFFVNDVTVGNNLSEHISEVVLNFLILLYHEVTGKVVIMAISDS